MTTQLEKETFKSPASDYLLTYLPGHAYWKDLKGTFLGCNKEQASTFKLSDTSEVVGKTNFDFFDTETANNLNALDSMVIKENRTIEKIEKVGESEYFLSKKSPLRDKDGNVIGILGVSLNITKQHHVELELIQKTKELDAALKGLNLVSHEIKNTIQGMLGISEEVLIAWKRIKDDDKKIYFQDVLNSRNRLMLFLEDILEVAKLRSDILKFAFANCSTDEFVKKIANEYNRAPTVVVLSILKDTPETMYCDQGRIQQVLDNLLRNAIRHGGRDQQITISTSASAKHQGFVEITVQDQGIGIPNDELELVFKSFYESSLTRQKKGGTGLGLSICKEIINAHHGLIWVEPNQKKGAAFSFTIPISAEVHIQNTRS